MSVQVIQPPRCHLSRAECRAAVELHSCTCFNHCACIACRPLVRLVMQCELKLDPPLAGHLPSPGLIGSAGPTPHSTPPQLHCQNACRHHAVFTLPQHCQGVGCIDELLHDHLRVEIIEMACKESLTLLTWAVSHIRSQASLARTAGGPVAPELDCYNVSCICLFCRYVSKRALHAIAKSCEACAPGESHRCLRPQ